jgi:hypothetical protein
MKLNKKAKDETSFIKPSLSFGKRGIMVKFLLTLIIAIIIFVPACLFVSNVFRLSSQANENFGEFVQEIGNLAEKGREGETESFQLIMDEETAIVGFNKNSSKVESCEKKSESGKVFCGHWPKPDTDECKGESCVCLITSIIGWKEAGSRTPDFLYTGFNCKKISDVTFGMQNEIQSFSAIWGEQKSDFIVTGGFFFGRKIDSIKVSGPLGYFPHSFNLDNRRNNIYLIKKDNKVLVCLDSKWPVYKKITS